MGQRLMSVSIQFRLCTICRWPFPSGPDSRSLHLHGLPVLSVAPTSIVIIPYVAWSSVLVWYMNLIAASGGGVGVQLNSLFIGTVPLIFATCCACTKPRPEVRKQHSS